MRERYLEKKNSQLPERITKSGIYYADRTCTLNVTLVGGGGGGAGDSYKAGWCGNGGFGGQVESFQIPVSVGSVLDITIGKGGKGGNHNNSGSNGGDTILNVDGTEYIALGGSGGVVRKGYDQVYGTGHKGGRGAVGANDQVGEVGADGELSPYENLYRKYGAGGGGGSNSYMTSTGSIPRISGGETSGGLGGGGSDNSNDNTGGDGGTYGAGGGGAAFSSSHSKSIGGNGHDGLVLIYYNK